MARKRTLTYQQAVEDILVFVEEGEEDENFGEDLYGEDENIQLQPDGVDDNEPVLPEESISSDEEDQVDVPTQRRKHRRKQLTYTRKVNSIDTSLDENNYNRFEIPEHKKEIISKVDGVSKTFANKPDTVTGRQQNCNVIRNKPGLSPLAKNKETELECFELFFTNEMMRNIAHTNRRIQETTNQLDKIDQWPYRAYVKEIDEVDFRAFIGLVYLRGLYGLNTYDIRTLFSDEHGMPVFSATMSRVRFEFILKHLCFDDHTTREDRWKNDRYAAMREFFEDCNTRFGKMLVPEDYLSLDETLYPMRTQIAFKQYNPNKPAKYGMLFKSINCSRYPYTYQSHVYCGKPEGEPNQFYIAGTNNYIKFLVEKLNGYHSLKGRNISMDRLYTNLEIADWLFRKSITTIGTMQHNRVGIPKELKTVENKEELSSEIFWEVGGAKRFVSYTVKTSKGKKNVIMLTTAEPLLGVTMDDNKSKPALIKLYDFTKGGTDIVDQKMGFYSTKTKSRRWIVTAFSYLLDTIRVNACTVYGLNQKIDPKKVDSFNFIYAIGKALVTPHIERRPRDGLTSVIRRKISLFTGKDDKMDTRNLPAAHEQFIPTKTRCSLCMEEIQGEGMKEKKQKLTKVKTACQKCGNATCKKHFFIICNQCFEN